MGPPTKKSAVAPPSSSSSASTRRCLLCRRDALSPAQQQKHSPKSLKSCAISLCTIFGLADNHPFQVIYERAQYCEPCLEEVQEADVTLGKLELMKQSLLRFQNRVYSKLGDNYFQIENRENLNASFVDFEKGAEALKGKKFSYDEIVKVVYEKLDKDCLKWERFSSEGQSNLGPSPWSAENRLDAASKTDSAGVILGDSSQSIQQSLSSQQQVSFPDIDDDATCGCTGAGGDDDFGGGGGSDFEEGAAPDNASSIYDDPLDGISSNAAKRQRVEIDYGPQAKGLPFTQTPRNFDEKIYCQEDPENCKRFFYDEYNLKVHIRSFHQGNPLPHECTVCMKSFIDEGRLKNHFLRVHATGESFMCDQCGTGFPSPQILREHVRKKHLNATDSYPCSFCTAPFISSQDLKEHENLHRLKEVPFTCVYCDQSCPNSTALRSHYNSSHSDNRVACELCGKLLANEHSLKNHMNLHTETYKCDTCGFTGTSKNTLKQHLLTHSTEKGFSCEVCGHAFKYFKNLTSHMRIHTGEKPYCCAICGQSFREQSYLRRHKEGHSNLNNYSCPDCGMGFKARENMKKHQRIHKKNKYRPRSRKWRGGLKGS